MKMRDAIRQFYFWQLQNGKASATASGYRAILEDLPFQEKEIKDITPGDLQNFLAGFQGLSPSSLNVKRACLRSFFKWCLENDFIQRDPSRLIHLEKIPMKEAKYLSLAEVRKFREAIKDDPRNQLLFELYLGTGCRLSEIQALNIGDVRTKKSCRVVGKGKKSREVFLPEYLTKLVRNSVNGNRADSPLFLSERGERLSRGRIQAMFKEYCRRAGIKGVSVHSLRHTFLTEVYRRSKDLRLVQELAGHSSPVTTMRYTHVAEIDKKRAVQKLYE